MDTELDAALKRMTGSGGHADVNGPCLSADVLAAWAEGTLPPRERVRAEAHAADCPRCLEVLAAVIRTAPAEASPGLSWWRAPWRVRWVAPLAAAATAFALWIYVGSAPPPESAPGSSAALDPASPPVSESPSTGPDFVPSDPQAPRDASKRVRSFPEAAVAAPDRAAQSQEREYREKPSVSAEVRRQAPDAASPAPGAPPAEPRGDRQEATTQTLPALQDSAAARAADTSAATEVISPDPSTRWRLEGTSIDRSADGGATWARQFTARVPLVAGHAPARGVCWIVGGQGTVLVSRDGQTWQQVAAPADVDLVRVEAADGRSASVTAADGRVFRTSDGGQTWALQESEAAPF